LLALITSAALVLYVLVPGPLFRFCYAYFIPLKEFQRTRAQEVEYAARVGLLPLLLALVLRFWVPWTSAHPFPVQRQDSVCRDTNDYRNVLGGAYSEKVFDENPPCFWRALNRVGRRQARFLTWFYVLLMGEAALFGWLSQNLWRFYSHDWLSRLADNVLVPQISEWYLLLTPAYFAGYRTLRPRLDLLTSENFYRGTLGSYRADSEGNLTALMLRDAQRFDRRGYQQEKDAGREPSSESYWKDIPGAPLYFPYDKIMNFNVRWEPELGIRPEELVREVLKRMGIKAAVTMSESPAERESGDAARHD